MISLSKVANIEDFNSEDFKELYSKYCIYGFPNDKSMSVKLLERVWPEGQNRKVWEVSMALLSFDRMGLLNNNKEFLGIGVGKEETITVLSNHSRRVFATDIYLEPGTWNEWHSEDILLNPSAHFDERINLKRVVFQHVDGRNLPYEDESFDGVFSCSSIEHFGDESEIRRSIEEVYRVLKPGGVAAISTEYKISSPDDQSGFDNVQLFDEERLKRVWIDGLNWTALDFLDSDYCKSEEIDFIRSINDVDYINSQFPHMILKKDKFKWTSVHLTLIKGE